MIKPYHAIGVDVGGTAVKVAVIDNKGNILSLKRENTAKESIDSLVTQTTRLISDVLTNAKLDVKEVKGVGVSYPALFSKYSRELYNVPFNVPPITKSRLADLLCASLETKFKTKINVYTETDHITPILGENWVGHAKGARNAVYLTLGTGISCGILIDGKPYYGLEGCAGSIGWMLLGDNFLGRKYPLGCFEYYCSAPGILKRTLDRVKEGEKSTILELAKEKSGNISCADVFDAARKGDPLSAKIIKETSMYIGIVILNLICVLAPEIIILGGGVGQSYDLLIGGIREVVDNYLMLPSKKVRIVPSLLGDKAALIGAGRLVFY